MPDSAQTPANLSGSTLAFWLTRPMAEQALPASWIAALETARDGLGCTYFDWLSAVDEPGTGFRVCAHLAALPDRSGLVVGPAVAAPDRPLALTE